MCLKLAACLVGVKKGMLVKRQALCEWYLFMAASLYYECFRKRLAKFYLPRRFLSNETNTKSWCGEMSRFKDQTSLVCKYCDSSFSTIKLGSHKTIVKCYRRRMQHSDSGCQIVGKNDTVYWSDSPFHLQESRIIRHNPCTFMYNNLYSLLSNIVKNLSSRNTLLTVNILLSCFSYARIAAVWWIMLLTQYTDHLRNYCFL